MLELVNINKGLEEYKDRPLFLYCLRGSRSKRAAGILKKLGYGQVKNIGGIAGYHGDLER